MAENKISFWILTALVVGNMIGSGIFMLQHKREVKSAGPK